MKTIIVAYDKHFGIGANNDLLWQRDLPADLQHFKENTTGQAVIMGLNTYKSIGRPLPNRQNIVLDLHRDLMEGVTVVSSLDDAYAAVESDKETFVIGGGQIYALAFETVDRILATEVDAMFEQATVFFPVVDVNKWQEVDRQHHETDDKNLYNYDFVTYLRR